METHSKTVTIEHFSDMLCIWAYISQIRVDEVCQNFPGEVRFVYHFVPVFGDVQSKIHQAWKERGGFSGYARHVREAVAQFEHCQIHESLWEGDQVPASSGSPHLFVKALQVLERDGTFRDVRVAGRSVCEEVAWRLRQLFFQEGRDIARLEVQLAVAEELKLARAPIEEALHDGRAMAGLMHDIKIAEGYQVMGSPTYVLNGGRQKLYGNVGYRVIEANVKEMLRVPGNQASWC